MRRLARYAVAALLTAGVSLASVYYAQRRIAAADSAPAHPPLATTWQYGTEQEWIVAQVVKAIANMAHYAQTRSAADARALEVRVATQTDAGGVPTFEVTLPARGKTWRLRADEYIWAPGMYAPLAADLFGLKTDAAPKANGVSESVTLAALTRPRTEAMVAESERVSSELSRDMANPDSQEDAALLFATLALREYAGFFYDNHRSLCRLAAHLAVATAVRKGAEPTLAGRYAEITLLTLAFAPQRMSLGRLEALESRPDPSPTVRSWNRALRMRNTEDWRVLADPLHASLLERLEYFTWISWKTGLSSGLDFLDKTDVEETPDWGNRLLTGGVNVEAGQRFIPAGMAMVLNDAMAMPLGLGEGADTSVVASDPKRVVAALNTEPAAGPVRAENGRVVVEVLDRGTWAAWTQRHLLHHVDKGVWFTENMLGLPDEAKAWKAELEKSYGGLRQFPLVARRLAKDSPSYEAAMKGSLALLRTSPDWVGGYNWNTLLARPLFPAPAFAVPPVEAWYHPLFPVGTYFEWPKRLWDPDDHLRVRGAPLQAMRDALPNYSRVVRAAVYDRVGDKATADELRRAYGPLVEYDVNVMNEVAWAARNDPDEYKRLRRRMGELDPDRIVNLAYYLVDHGEFEEAARAYGDYVDRARDRVAVSNSVRWYVNYLYDTGKKDRALEVARQAAEVYSGRGLMTLALLYERMGRWTDAEEYVRKLHARYEGNDPTLLAFYLRRQRANREGGDGALRETLLRKLFPAGIENANGAEAGPPRDGVEVVGTSDESERAGLAERDVIVALDGLRVHTHDQYSTIRDLRREPAMTLRVWRRDRYLDLSATRFDRWFAVEARTYKAPPDGKRKYI